MKNFSTGFNFPTQQEAISENESERGNAEEDKEDQDTSHSSGGRRNCEWDFRLSTVVSSSSSAAEGGAAVSNTLGVIEFDPTDTVLATGGIARKIRVYTLKSLLPNNDQFGRGGANLLDHVTACEYTICTPAKLSSLRWRPGSDGRVLGSGDYDGVVTEYDLETRAPIFERDEHGGRRVWSVDYSHYSGRVIGASGSDDGTLQIWDPRCDGGECVAAVQPSGSARNAVCCVEFDPFGGAMVAVGCSDRRAYGYDVRKMSDPVLVLDGHEKTVTYVRFLDRRSVVTAGTDGCLKMWDTENISRAVRTYKGHRNKRSFVGLSVWRNGGLIGCGSENNRVFVYDKRWGEPVWVHGFGAAGPGSCMGGWGDESGFVSSVCWRQLGEEECTLVAGGSDGVLQVFLGTKKLSMKPD